MTTAVSSGAAVAVSDVIGQTAAPNPFQPSASTTSDIVAPGSTNHGLCSLTHSGNVFRFRTNPNEIWWTYELITHIEQTYGGRVVQILGTRLGDLTVKVECGLGGWDYLMRVVTYLRDVISDQRGGQPATFEYTTRNWKMNVYAMNVPFADQVSATVRELTMTFKIQEDVNGIVSGATLSTELARLQDGIYRPGQNIHNKYNDSSTDVDLDPAGSLGSAVDITQFQSGAGGPSGFGQIGTPNTVDSTPQGATQNSIPGLGLLPSIPGLSGFLGGFGG